MCYQIQPLLNDVFRNDQGSASQIQHGKSMGLYLKLTTNSSDLIDYGGGLGGFHEGVYASIGDYMSYFDFSTASVGPSQVALVTLTSLR